MQKTAQNRRDLIKSSVAATGVFAFASVVAAQAVGSSPALAAPDAKLVDTTSACIKAGEACETHCIAELGKGNKDMAGCLAAVREMLASCQALLSLASAGSKHTKAMAAVCAQVCSDCAKSCEPHAQHMAVCGKCRDACLDCEKACKAA